MTQSSCISACLACVFHNMTLVFCIKHPPNLFNEGWTDLGVTLCALLKCYLCPIASHWSVDTQPSHPSWLATVVSHSFFLITSPGLLLWLKYFSRWGAPAPEGQCVYLPALQQHELLPAELPSASRSFPLAADSSTNSSVSHQSRCPGGKTAEASFSHPPSPLTSCSAAQSSGVRHRNLNLTVPLLQQGLTPPPSFLMSRAGRQHSRESKGIQGGSGERVLLQDRRSGNWCSGSRNS